MEWVKALKGYYFPNEKLYTGGIDYYREMLENRESLIEIASILSGPTRIQPEINLNFIEKTKPTENLLKIFKILESEYKLKENVDFYFDSTLARGLDYYTSTVFEMKLNGNPNDLSIGGGGRYDNLIGMFAGRKIPAVGFSFGIDRIVELQ